MFFHKNIARNFFIDISYMYILIHSSTYFALGYRISWWPVGAIGQLSVLSFLRCRTTWTSFLRRDSTAHHHTQFTFQDQQRVSSELGKNTFKRWNTHYWLEFFIVIYFRFIGSGHYWLHAHHGCGVVKICILSCDQILLKIF